MIEAGSAMALPFLFQHFDRKSSTSIIQSDTRFAGEAAPHENHKVCGLDEELNALSDTVRKVKSYLFQIKQLSFCSIIFLLKVSL